MSKGPGRLQRAILFVLEHPYEEEWENIPLHRLNALGPKEATETTEWTTEDIAAVLSNKVLYSRNLDGTQRGELARKLRERGESGWDNTDIFVRQVRRALDSLCAAGLVSKELDMHHLYGRNTQVALWSLVE